MSSAVCASCQRGIDAAAKICPYCGADPVSGERVDTQAILQEVFRPRDASASASVLEYARQRQGIVLALAVIAGILVLAGLHTYVTRRNATDVSAAPAVPLSEITAMTKPPEDTTPQPLPELEFQYDGRAQSMRTYIVERGATTPPEVLAAQQQAAAASQQQPAATRQRR